MLSYICIYIFVTVCYLYLSRYNRNMKIKSVISLFITSLCAFTVVSCGGGGGGGGSATADGTDSSSTDPSGESTEAPAKPAYLLPENVSSAHFTIIGRGVKLNLNVTVKTVAGNVWQADMTGSATLSADIVELDTDHDVTFELKPCRLERVGETGIVLEATPIDSGNLSYEDEAKLEIDNMEVQFSSVNTNERQGIIGDVGEFIITYLVPAWGGREEYRHPLEFNLNGATIILNNYSVK